jgi:hypothetical protein
MICCTVVNSLGPRGGEPGDHWDTDYAQERLGEILSLDLPECDAYVERDEPFAASNRPRRWWNSSPR